MICLLALTLLPAHDSGMSSYDARTTVCCRVYVTEAKVLRRHYIRLARQANLLDAVAALPTGTFTKTNAKISVVRGSKTLKVDLRAIIREGDCRTNYDICPGDIIVIELP